MKLYLVLKELNLLATKISYDTPVYIDKTHLFTGFNKRNDGFLIPQVKKDCGEYYKSNLIAVLTQLNNIRKLKHCYLEYELVFPKIEPFVAAKFAYDRINEIMVLEEDKYPFAPAQFDRFCTYNQIKGEDKTRLLYFIENKREQLNERIVKILNGILKIEINPSNKYLIALLITKINKY
jgi:hypothetical protein